MLSPERRKVVSQPSSQAFLWGGSDRYSGIVLTTHPGVQRMGNKSDDMLVLIHKECGGPALEESPVGEVCAVPVDRFPFSCFSCLEEIIDESELRLIEDLGI